VPHRSRRIRESGHGNGRGPKGPSHGDDWLETAFVRGVQIEHCEHSSVVSSGRGPTRMQLHGVSQASSQTGFARNNVGTPHLQVATPCGTSLDSVAAVTFDSRQFRYE
jgi:hypothetical protein